jgi:hypothetical protein
LRTQVETQGPRWGGPHSPSLPLRVLTWPRWEVKPAHSSGALCTGSQAIKEVHQVMLERGT